MFMADESRIEVQDDQLKDPIGDKTPEEKNEEIEDDISSKEEDEELEKKPDDKKNDKVDRSDIAQKIKYREKYQKAAAEVDRLKKQLDDNNRSPKEAAADEKELAAQKYIRDLARREYEEIRKKEIEEKATELDKFEEEVDSILEDYPDISREDLLDTIEEYDVPPSTAVKILEKSGKPNSSRKEKPRMPSPKRGGGAPAKKNHDDKGKSFYDISRELAKEARDEGVL